MSNAPNSDPMIGRLLDGRYLINRKAGNGGMAIVYEAIDKRLSRTVAIKVLRDDLASDPEYITRFNREARAAAGLTHPGIVSVFDQGIEQSRPFIVMEYVPGGTLRHLISNTAPIGSRRTLDIMLPIVDAVAYAHEAGLLHRDLKPENVLISDRNQIKVADFGLAKPVASNTNSNAGTLMGSISYVAPEIVTNSPYDARADVYALGVILYELLTGEKPHKGENAVAVAYSHVHNDIAAPSSVLAGGEGFIPDYLDALVMTAAARDPQERPRDGSVLLAHLRLVRQALKDGIRSDPALADKMGETTLNQDEQLTQTIPDLPSAPESTAPLVHTPQMPIPGMDQVTAKATSLKTGKTPAKAKALQKKQVTKRHRGVALLLVILLIAGLGGFGTWYITLGRYTEAPNFVGLNEAKATNLAQSKGLTINFTKAYHEDVPIGEIISTTPVAGEQIVINSEISAVVSKGQERYTVPKVVGKTVNAATDALAKAHLTVGEKVEAYDDKVKAGKVISQSEEVDKRVPPNTVVVLTVSLGPAPVDFGDYTGQVFEDIKNMCTEAGLKVETSEKVYNNDVEKGLIVSQEPPAGQLHRGDTVSFVVSKGPELKEVPYVKYKNVQEASKILRAAGFDVDVKYDSNLLGLVAYTRPSANTKAPIGSTVELHVL